VKGVRADPLVPTDIGIGLLRTCLKNECGVWLVAVVVRGGVGGGGEKRMGMGLEAFLIS
jgi:hypothetical protein